MSRALIKVNCMILSQKHVTTPTQTKLNNITCSSSWAEPLKSFRKFISTSHLAPHSSLLFVHNSYSTRSSGCGTDSRQSRLTCTISPSFTAFFNISPNFWVIRADGMVIFWMYLAASSSSLGRSMVINGSSLSSATRTAEAPATWAFHTFFAKRHSIKKIDELVRGVQICRTNQVASEPVYCRITRRAPITFWIENRD